MSLIPIVYTSLIIFSGLLAVIIIVSYILSKIKSNNNKPYEAVTKHYINSSISKPNYKKAVVLTNNNVNYNYSSDNLFTEPKRSTVINEEKRHTQDNYGYNKRYVRVNTNADYFGDDPKAYRSYHRKKEINYSDDNLYRYYAEI
jgi:hypothetical protein